MINMKIGENPMVWVGPFPAPLVHHCATPRSLRVDTRPHGGCYGVQPPVLTDPRPASRVPFRSVGGPVPPPGTPNNQKEMDVSPNNPFPCKGFQLPYWNNHLFLVVWGSRHELGAKPEPGLNRTERTKDAKGPFAPGSRSGTPREADVTKDERAVRGSHPTQEGDRNATGETRRLWTGPMDPHGVGVCATAPTDRPLENLKKEGAEKTCHGCQHRCKWYVAFFTRPWPRLQDGSKA